MSHGGSWVFPIAFAPYSESDDLTQIVSGSDGGTIKVWTIDDLTGTPDIISVQTYPAPSGAVYSLDWWSTPGDSITRIVAGGDGDITVYDAANDMNILFRAVNAHAGRVNDVAFSPDGSMIVSGGADGALKLWDLSDP
jgi:WD40 repeat protein